MNQEQNQIDESQDRINNHQAKYNGTSLVIHVLLTAAIVVIAISLDFKIQQVDKRVTEHALINNERDTVFGKKLLQLSKDYTNIVHTIEKLKK